MAYAMYDKVKLKDGRSGFIVYIFNAGEAYVIESETKNFSDRLITVKKEDIEMKII